MKPVFPKFSELSVSAPFAGSVGELFLLSIINLPLGILLLIGIILISLLGILIIG
jgi:hypothetical protein